MIAQTDKKRNRNTDNICQSQQKPHAFPCALNCSKVRTKLGIRRFAGYYPCGIFATIRPKSLGVAESRQVMERDVIIIGGGVAGLSAGYWCAELGLSSLVLEREAELGGTLLRVFNPLHNHLGARAENGKELRDQIAVQIRNSAMEIRTGVEVRSVDLVEKKIELTDGSMLEAKSLMIATGTRRRKLHVPGEDEFAGKGILFSGAKDPEAVAGLDVCVIGGGDAAFENAVILAEHGRSVTIVHHSDHFRAREEFREKVNANPKITIIANAKVLEIAGDGAVESVKISDNSTGKKSDIPAQAVLIRVGVKPNTELFKDQLERDERGYISVNARCETSVEGVYAVGDVANPDAKTVSTAAGTGATAAHVILKKKI
jgi:thioredoxin reductase (NADPH)